MSVKNGKGKGNGNGTVPGFGEIDFHIRGRTRHTQHNPQTVNPRNEYARAMKAITSKRKKSEEELEELARLEWEASLYLKDGKIVVPGNVIEGALCEAGRKSKTGPEVRAGLWSPGSWELDFPGKERPIQEIMEDENHFYVTRVGIKTSSIMRTRASFPVWSLRFRVCYLKEIFGERDIFNLVEVLGNFVGLSDCRTKMGGRFDILSPVKA